LTVWAGSKTHWRRYNSEAAFFNTDYCVFNDASLKKELTLTKEKFEQMEKVVEEKDHKLQKFDLVCAILGAKSKKHQFVDDFAYLITHDFQDFCSIETNVNNVMTKTKLDDILGEMRRIANCPEIYSKTLVAVGGGVRSGKSSFINSFITGGNIKLVEARGQGATTAIPSYVMSAKKSEINGINYKGVRFAIAPEMYAAISQEFLRSFLFDLKEIIQYTMVHCFLNADLFNNICLIDTPSVATEKDFPTALNYIKEASILIWTVSIDKGTIPKDNFKFLEKTPFGQNSDKLLYIVANKAELKGPTAVKDILNQIKEYLDNQDIRYEGISAYSSKRRRELAYRKIGVTDFLRACTIPSKIYAKVSDSLKEVWSYYEKEIQRDYDENKEKYNKVNSMLLDILQSGRNNVDDTLIKLEKGLKSLKKSFESKSDKKNLEDRLKCLNDISKKFQDCFDKFCDANGIDRRIKSLKDKPLLKSRDDQTDAGKRQTSDAAKDKPLPKPRDDQTDAGKRQTMKGEPLPKSRDDQTDAGKRQTKEAAYYIWVNRGYPVGQDDEIWAEAEREMKEAE
jgi:hypothetical protein